MTNIRTRHAAVYDAETDEIYVYGGFDLNSVLGDLLVYSFRHNTWRPLQSSRLKNGVTNKVSTEKDTFLSLSVAGFPIN